MTGAPLVVLDACVLANFSLCDKLLRLAEPPQLFETKWSEEIIRETTRTLELKVGWPSSLTAHFEKELRLIIGGRAVQFHGHIRPAQDLDLLVEFSAENWEKLGRALRPLNAAVPAFDGLSAGRRYQTKLNFYPTVEFLTSIDGVSFEQAWSDGVETIVEDVQVRVLSKLHRTETPEC